MSHHSMMSFIFDYVVNSILLMCVQFLKNRHGRSKETPVPRPSKAPKRTDDSQGVPKDLEGAASKNPSTESTE